MNRLKELRNEKGSSLKEVADSVGLAESQLSYYENEKRQPRDMTTWEKLADYFNVSVGYLMGISNQRVSEEKALEIAKKIFFELLENKTELDERELKALEYYKDKDLDSALKEAMIRYFSIPVILQHEEYLNLKDLSALKNDIPYALWEKYRTEVKNNQNLIDDFYYSLPIEERAYEYKNFDVIRDNVSLPNHKHIHLMTRLVENGIDKDLENDIAKIIEDTFNQLDSLRSKYPDRESDIIQSTQALVRNPETGEELFWKRVDGIDIKDETDLSDEEKEKLVEIASNLIRDNSLAE